MADLVYLACPYSHPDPRIKQSRFDLACRVAADLSKKGILVFSPLSHCVPIANYGLGDDWRYWAEHNSEVLRRCNKVIVIKAEGWESSVGVTAELKIARGLGLPIEYLEVQRQQF